MTSEELKEKLRSAENKVFSLKGELAAALAKEQGFSIDDVVMDCNHELWRIVSFGVDKYIGLLPYGIPLDENGKDTGRPIYKISTLELKKVEVNK